MAKFLKILLLFFIVFFATPSFGEGAEYEMLSVQDEEYGDDMYTPGMPLLLLELQKFAKTKDIEIQDYVSSMIDVLADIEYPENRVNDKCYYKIVARKTQKYKKQVKSDLTSKFGSERNIGDLIRWRPSKENELILFAMFYKNIEFKKNFETLPAGYFNSSRTKVKYFGIKNYPRAFKDIVFPLFYNNNNDFALLIRTKSDDEIILYRTDSPDSIDILWDEVQIKADEAPKNDSFQPDDAFMAPYVNLKHLFVYNELTKKRIVGTKFIISRIFETVEFNFGNKGQKFKDDKFTGAITGVKKRTFYFNKPFVLFAKEKGKDYPYFMVRVKDTKFISN